MSSALPRGRPRPLKLDGRGALDEVSAMFATFFTELRAAGVPVTLREYLTLMEAMEPTSPAAGSNPSTICRARPW